MVTKVCTKCGQEKPLSEFGKHKRSKDGRAWHCLECSRKHSKYFRETPAGIYQQIKGQIKFSQKHKGKRDYRGYIRIPRKDLLCSQNEFVKWYESHPKICAYCDISEKELHAIEDVWNKKIIRLTVDCVDNNKGYSIDNMTLSCGRCNITKNDFFTFEEMQVIGKIIRSHWEPNKDEERSL